MLALLTCFIFTVWAADEHMEYYPGQAADPLSNIVTFKAISEIKAQAELELSRCVTTRQQLSVLERYEHKFSMLAEDGEGGITQQGKYATMLRESCSNHILDIYAGLIDKHNSGEKTLTCEEAFEIACFYEKHRIRECHELFVYARDFKK
jgi:hypothetical protein